DVGVDLRAGREVRVDQDPNLLAEPGALDLQAAVGCLGALADDLLPDLPAIGDHGVLTLEGGHLDDPADDRIALALDVAPGDAVAAHEAVRVATAQGRDARHALATGHASGGGDVHADVVVGPDVDLLEAELDLLALRRVEACAHPGLPTQAPG